MGPAQPGEKLGLCLQKNSPKCPSTFTPQPHQIHTPQEMFGRELSGLGTANSYGQISCRHHT